MTYYDLKAQERTNIRRLIEGDPAAYRPSSVSIPPMLEPAASEPRGRRVIFRFKHEVDWQIVFAWLISFSVAWGMVGLLIWIVGWFSEMALKNY